MFRLTRHLLQQTSTLSRTTGLTGLDSHPNPLPALREAYESTLSRVSSIPKTSVYRQSVEALTRNKLAVAQNENTVDRLETQLDEGMIEQSIQIANDELNLMEKMIEWKA